MVRAWYMDDDPSDQRDEHHRTPPKFVDLDELNRTTGVQYVKLNMDTIDSDGVLEAIKREKGYTYEDELVCSRECLSNYDEKLKVFYTEHLHTDDEIRVCVDGSGFFDVRDRNDEWIRVEVTPGDMLVLPGGIYHRFTMDRNNYVRARRLFIGEPVWTAYNRPVDEMTCRKSYLEKLDKGCFVTA